MTHELKVDIQFWQDLWWGRKRFEVRKNDRDFKKGDQLWLRPWDPETKSYARGQVDMYVTVTYILYGPGYGIEAGYCVMSFK